MRPAAAGRRDDGEVSAPRLPALCRGANCATATPP